jgi:hypothetical protein
MPRRNGNAGPRDVDLLQCGDGSTQLDFFGLVDAELIRRVEQAQWRAEFDARTTRMPDGAPVVWTARHAFPGVQVRESAPGRWCWLCGAVVANTFVLASQHGLSVDDPSCWDWTSCTAAPTTVPNPTASSRCTGEAGGEVA